MKEAAFELDELFEALEFSAPHTLFLSQNFEILKFGKVFLKSIPTLSEGMPFDAVFRWTHNNAKDSLNADKNALVFIESLDGKQRFKSACRKTKWGFVLHAAPVINANFHISSYHLTLKDFSQQDYISEYLFLLHSSTKSLEDANRLAEMYTDKNRALLESQEELMSTAIFPNENPNPVLRLSKKFELRYSNPAAVQFLEDFNISQSTVDDDELKLNLSYVETHQLDNFSMYLARNNNTYLVNIRNTKTSDFYNIYAANISHFVSQVQEKEGELTKLNKRLDQQQAFYEYILNNIPSDIAVFDDKHRYLFVNPQGIKSEEVRNYIIGKDDFDYCKFKGIDTKAAEFRRAKFLQVMKTNEEVEWEDDIVNSLGKRQVMMRRMRPIHNPINKKTNVVGYGIDITERKLAEESVRKSQVRLALLEQFLNATSDAVQVANDAGDFVYINNAASERMVIPMHEIQRYKVSDVDPKFKDPAVWQAHLTELRDKGSVTAETINVNKITGETVDLEVNFRYQIIDGKGYIIAASRDITERKLAQTILAYKNEFQAILMGVANEYIDLQPDDLSGAIDSTLSQIGHFVKVDRVYVFEYNHKEKFATNTYEWVAEGVQKEISNLQKLPFEQIPMWVESHFQGKNIEIENTALLPEGDFKTILIDQKIKSLIALPLMYENVCLGFVGFDAVKKQRKFYEDEKDLLQLYARMLVNVNVRMKNIREIEKSTRKIQSINEELEKIIQAEKTVNVLAASFLTGTNYQAICEDIVENIVSQLDFEDCIIYKLEGNNLVKVAATEDKNKRKRPLKNSMTVPYGKGIVGTVAKTGKALLVPDTSLDSRYLADGVQRASEVAVPINIGKKRWGVIDSENDQKNFFTDLHVRVLMTVANMLSQKIQALDEQSQKEKLQAEILEINADLENRVSEEINRNLTLTKSMADQEKMVTIGEIASGIAHDLNTPLGAIKIGAESIRYTLDNLFHDIVAKCTESQIKKAMNRAIELQGELFVGGLQQRREMKEMNEFLLVHYPEFENAERSKMVAMLVKTRINVSQEEFIKEILNASNAKEYLELIYSMQIVRNFIQTILTSSDRASKVVQDLRSFIKDQRNSEKASVNLHSNVSTVLNVFNYELKKNVELIFDVDKSYFVSGFDIKLFQLWSNIIKNAIESLDQYKDRGMIKITATENDGFVTVSIANNGPKIPDEIKEKIFDKFYTTKARKNGSGLGLSIVRSVLEEHNAKITLESDDSLTTFHVRFKKLDHSQPPKNEVEIELL